MREITMNLSGGQGFREVFEEFVISKTAQGVSDTTLNNYRYHLKGIAHYLDIERDISEITKRDIERMAAAMRKKGIKHNSIATYLRMLKTFFNWCKNEGFSYVDVPTFAEKETVKETYTKKGLLEYPELFDEEKEILREQLAQLKQLADDYRLRIKKLEEATWEN